MWYFAQSDSTKYKTLCMRKLELLGHKTNDELRKKLLRKEITGEDFAKKEMKVGLLFEMSLSYMI